MPKQVQKPGGEKECCLRTRARWEKRIRAHYASFPVVKDVPCDKCRQILEIRVYEAESV